jgi:hypothetical protein
MFNPKPLPQPRSPDVIAPKDLAKLLAEDGLPCHVGFGCYLFQMEPRQTNRVKDATDRAGGASHMILHDVLLAFVPMRGTTSPGAAQR